MRDITISDPARLRAMPEFKVLRPIVIAYTVLVMNVLACDQIATQGLLHDQPMLLNESAPRILRVLRYN